MKVNKNWVKQSKVIFSDDLIEIQDPENQAIKLILSEAVKVVSQLLVHPNQDVRRLVEKFVKDNNE